MKIDNFEVRSCPFCGSERLMLANGGVSSWLCCRDCLTMGPSCETPEEAVTKWNSVYPVLNTDTAGDWLERWLKDQDKKIYHGGDIREIITLLLTLKTETERLTQRINTILSIGEPRK